VSPVQSQFNGELLDAMRRGSDTAWADAYDMLAGDLRSFIGRLGAQSPDDVLGETMVQLVRDMKKFRGSPNEFRPWAFTVARHRVLDDARKRARRPVEVELLDEDDLATTDGLLVEGPDLARLSEVLDRLTTEQREVLWLRYALDHSLDQTADITGQSPEAVAAMAHRAVRRLRALL
jgi:RNA polymerase sigma-70 factor (ECF subfamily)